MEISVYAVRDCACGKGINQQLENGMHNSL